MTPQYPLREIKCRFCGVHLLTVRHNKRTKTICKACVIEQKKITSKAYFKKKRQSTIHQNNGVNWQLCNHRGDCKLSKNSKDVTCEMCKNITRLILSKVKK